MQKVIPCFYSEYGRYISRFRAIPLFIDGLKPVERRLLLSLKEKGSKKFQKSAKIIGHCMGEYHPHGDQSIYGSLVDMVKRELAQGEGNWGIEGLENDNAAAMRYTETRSQPWVNELAFTYCNKNYMKWEELELEEEPLFLPSPLPIGLIGHGIITGISFDTTTIPRYSREDLKNRLIWLINNESNYQQVRQIDLDSDDVDVTLLGPIVKPNIRNCTTFERESNAYHKLLIHGEGSIQIVPNGNIDSKTKRVHINGKSPLRHGFKNLARKCDGVDKNGKPIPKDKKIPGKIKDLSKTSCDVVIFPDKPRSQDLNQLATQVWGIISPTISFNCQFCDLDGKLYKLGIDQLLLTSYKYWKTTVNNKKVYEINRLYNTLFELHIIHYVRQMNLTGMATIDDIITQFNKNTYQPVQLETFDTKNNVWQQYTKSITEQDVRDVCSRKSIKQLIEVSIDFQKINQKISDTKTSIQNNDQECFQYLQSIS